MPFFVCKGKGGQMFREYNTVIRGRYGKPVEVSEELAERIRQYKNPVILEVDAKGCCIVDAPKAAPKKKAAPKAKAKPKKELEKAKVEMDAKPSKEKVKE